FDGGVAGIAVLVAVASLLGAVFASLSNGLAVLTRHRETLIGAVTTVTLPLVFLSSALMQAACCRVGSSGSRRSTPAPGPPPPDAPRPLPLPTGARSPPPP